MAAGRHSIGATTESSSWFINRKRSYLERKQVFWNLKALPSDILPATRSHLLAPLNSYQLGIKYSSTLDLQRTSLWNHPASFLAIVNNVTMNTVQLPIQHMDLISLGYINAASFLLHIGTLSIHVVILDNTVVSFFHFCRTLHATFNYAWTNLHSHAQWIKIPLTLHPF